jgi:hypothetical protein
MSSSEEAQALGRSEFWDERYAKADGDKPTHEWFRGFDALEPFFEKYLLEERGVNGKSERMLHCGSGDSVGFFSCVFLGKMDLWPRKLVTACLCSFFPAHINSRLKTNSIFLNI